MKAILLFLLLLMSGCAVQKFDSDEYKRIVIAETTIHQKDCYDIKTLKTDLDNFSNQLDYIETYESGLPNNSNTISMLNGLQDETIRFHNMLHTSTSVGFVYCDNKVAGMRHALNLILKAEGSKSQ